MITRLRRLRRILLAGLVLALAMATMAPAAAGPNGTDRPFKGTANGHTLFRIDNPLNCPGEADGGFGITSTATLHGNASHLGRVQVDVAHCPFFDGSLTQGKLVLHAANGDELHGSYTGTSTPVPDELFEPIFATFYISFDPDMSTGRFAGATGDAVLQAELTFEGFPDLNWPITANWYGSLSY